MQEDMPISSMFNTITNTVGLYFNQGIKQWHKHSCCGG